MWVVAKGAPFFEYSLLAPLLLCLLFVHFLDVTVSNIYFLTVQPFSSLEKRAVEGAIDEGIRAIEALLSLGWEKALSGVRI